MRELLDGELSALDLYAVARDEFFAASRLNLAI